MNVLVTGGCGFIGSHLVDALLADDHKVTVLDDLSVGKLDNLDDRASFIEGNICDQTLVVKLMHCADFCFHLASVVSVKQCIDHWLPSTYINAYGTKSILNAARVSVNGHKNVPVVFASSAAVYGDNQSLPLKENFQPHPISPYGLDKFSGELNTSIAYSLYGIPSCSFRFFNVFGPRQDPSSGYSGVITKFIYKLLNNQPIVIYGDGSQTRDFISVHDVIWVLMKAMKSELRGGVFNVCNQFETSINDIYNQLCEVTGQSAPVSYKESVKGDIYRSIGNNDLIKDKFNYRQSISIKQGLKELWKWYY